MSNKKALVVALVLAGIIVLGLSFNAKAATLLETLRKKGVITHEEAENIRIEEAKKNWLPENVEVDLSGEMELELIAGESDENSSCDGDCEIDMDKAVLSPKVTFKDTGVEFEMEFEFSESSAQFEEGGVTFTKMPGNLAQELFIGLENPFVKSGVQHTENYPMLGSALWRDQIYQVAWEAAVDPIYWGLMTGTAFNLDAKQVGEYSCSENEIWQFDDGKGDNADEWQVGFKLGAAPNIGDNGRLDILGYGFFGNLNQDGIDDLQSNLPNYTSNSDDMNFYGGRIVYEFNGLELAGELAQAELGKEEIDTWYIQAAYDISTGRKTWWKKFTPIIRYGEWNPDSENTYSSPLSWDREKTTVGIITKLTDNIKIKTEYSMLDEDTGGTGSNPADLDNNEFLMQMEVKF